MAQLFPMVMEHIFKADGENPGPGHLANFGRESRTQLL